MDTVQVILTYDDDNLPVLYVMDSTDGEERLVWLSDPTDLLEAIRYAEAYASANHMHYVRAIGNLL